MNAVVRHVYTCVECGGTFEANWDEQDARDEARRIFGETKPDDVVVCDVCYKHIIRAMNG